jgi:lysylphosphatidylglycerol synthetase-like protein (DUF2156 family)
MLAILKILHFLALAIGLGGGAANLVIGNMAGAEGAPVTRPIQKRIGRVSFGALLLLWITGIWMLGLGWRLEYLPPLFWIKIIVVLVMTVAAVTAQVALLRPGPDTPAKLKKLGLMATSAAGLAVVFAVLSFG